MHRAYSGEIVAEGNGQWGVAVERELMVVEGPGASLRWAWGGVMLLTRAWWNHWWRSGNRPVGVPSEGPLADLAKNARRVPRTPRWVTAVLLLGSVGALIVPVMREAMDTGIQVWAGLDRPWAAKPASLARLREAAQRNRDTQAMALLALVSDNAPERIRMANEAVRADKNLTWVYSQVRTLDGPDSGRSPLPREWIEKLQKRDPDNLMPRLLPAQESLIAFEKHWADEGLRGNYETTAVEHMSEDANWMGAMQSAFQVPKYESYDARRFDLYRTTAQRYGFRDFEMLRELLLRFYPQALGNARIYTEILLNRGEAAERAGHFHQAEELYHEPLDFSERMAAQGYTDWERLAWSGIQRACLRRLQSLYVKTGQRDEEARVDYRLAALQASFLSTSPAMNWARSENGWEGLMIRFLAGAVILLIAACMVGLAVLTLGARTPVESRTFGMALASLAVDYCPVLLLLSCAGLFVSYRPVALTYERYMHWTLPIYDFRALVYALFTPYEMPEGVVRLVSVFFTRENYWLAGIVGFSITAIYVVFRRTLRRLVV